MGSLNEAANISRRADAEALREIRAIKSTAAARECAARIIEERRYKALRVDRLLGAIHSVGAVKIDAILQHCNISMPDQRLRELSVRQLLALQAVLLSDSRWRAVPHCDTSNNLANVHPREDCLGQYCSIHRPSLHGLRYAPLRWRSDRGLMERVCQHGVGHPDPDHIAYVRARLGDVHADAQQVHGCDGCCTSDRVRP